MLRLRGQQILQLPGPLVGTRVVGAGVIGHPTEQGDAGIEVARVGRDPAAERRTRQFLRRLGQQGERQRFQHLPPRLRPHRLIRPPADLLRLEEAILQAEHFQPDQPRLGLRQVKPARRLQRPIRLTRPT